MFKTNASASQPNGVTIGKVDAIQLRLGSLNAGVQQSMLQGKKNRKVIASLQRVVQTCVSEGNLDIFCFCEVGGHKQGLRAAGIHPQDFHLFQKTGQVKTTQNYMTCWDFDDEARVPSVQFLEDRLICVTYT